MGLGVSEGVRGTRECVQGLGKGWWDWTRRFVHYCVELLVLVSFLADLVVVCSVSLALCLDGLSCVRFAVVHPSVHSNDPDAA